MIPGINPRQMQRLMRQMGMEQEEIEALRVEIITNEKKIVIEPCQVSKVNMMGQETWQVIGEAREESLNQEVEITEEDVKTVMEQANVSEKEAKKAIKEANYDLAEAIMKLTAEKE